MEEVEKRKKSLLCAMSLFNISNDLIKINPEFSKACFNMSKALLCDVKDDDLPEAQPHTPGTIHNSHLKEEIEGIIKEIQAE